MIFSSLSFRLHPSSFILAMALTVSIAPAYAIDEGVAEGSLVVNGRAIALAHAYAHQYNGADGALGAPELRILLTDRKVVHTLLAGAHPAGLYDAVRRGELEGVLITVHAQKPAAGLRGVLLVGAGPPARFSQSAGGGIDKLRVGNNRVLGEARHRALDASPPFEYAATFSAPLFREGRQPAAHQAH